MIQCGPLSKFIYWRKKRCKLLIYLDKKPDKQLIDSMQTKGHLKFFFSLEDVQA